MLVKQKSKLTLEELPGELQTQKHGKSRQKCTQVFVFVFQFLRRILLCQCFHTVSKSIKQLMPNPWHFICGGGSKHLKYSRRRDTKTSKNGAMAVKSAHDFDLESTVTPTDVSIEIRAERWTDTSSSPVSVDLITAEP